MLATIAQLERMERMSKEEKVYLSCLYAEEMGAGNSSEMCPGCRRRESAGWGWESRRGSGESGGAWKGDVRALW